jgi:plasmid stability protein
VKEEALKNITLSADEAVIELARKKAMEHHHSLNDEFRTWLRSYVSDRATDVEYEAMTRQLSHIVSGGPFSRDEANER